MSISLEAIARQLVVVSSWFLSIRRLSDFQTSNYSSKDESASFGTFISVSEFLCVKSYIKI